MPLLKKKVFEKAKLPDGLRDDEEVFYCEITNEIFRDYEEFSERMFLCNSMVWTCAFTGKSNLTYVEALESEENARKCLKEFPTELKIPMLFLASKTKRTSFADMAEDVFMYAKDRYFIGENLESSFTSNKWKDSHVLQVLPPSESSKKPPVKNGANKEKTFLPLPVMYKYEIEHMDADDEDISEIMIMDCNQLRRKKGVFSRERCKLFLKQYVEQDDRGIMIVKPSVMEEFGITKMKFEQIFAGPLPNFEASKSYQRALNGQKKSKQATLNKFLNQDQKEIMSHERTVSLLEQMRKREEEFKLMKQQKEEEKLALKQKKKEDNIKLAAHLKDWYKIREDLELEDQKRLPQLPVVKSKVPDKYIGDMLMILEFVESFSKLLCTKDFFPGGLSFELMERALVEKEVVGPLTDIIQMLLSALFSVQEEEASQYKTEIEETSDIKEEDLSNSLSLHEATRLATMASSWSSKYQGLPLSRLPLYSLTVSEVLRLHLLSSGARVKESGARWRFQQRGGYTSEDDPGLYLRLHQPHILKALALHNVVQLSITDKLKIINCLMNQLLTYAGVRDVIEERIEKSRTSKLDLKTVQAAERKREQEYITAKLKIKRLMKEDSATAQTELDKLEREAERKRGEYHCKLDKLSKASYDKQVLMGMDRAYRKYFKLESIPGVFVNFDEQNPGICLDEPVKQLSHLVDVDRATIISHIKKIHDDLNSSDKENNPEATKINGMTNGHVEDEPDELLLCSADPHSCVVHSNKTEKGKWYFLNLEEQVEEFIKCLNKRGIRESDLRAVFESNKDELQHFISKTPLTQLNPSLEVEVESEGKPAPKKRGKDRYEDPNLGYPADMPTEEVLHNAMVDNILEMEEKIFAGNLGGLRLKDREAWRNCLSTKNYDKMDKTILKHKENGRHLKVKKEEESRPNTPDSGSTEIKVYQDPGKFVGITLDVDSEDSDIDEGSVLIHHHSISKAIHCLSIALVQVAYAVEPKYLKKPLGCADLTKNDRKKDDYNVLERWEQSLLASTSFSQVFLHYGTLDSCVMWSRSVLLARCRVCRRQRDSENMLLCDSCNLGHHLYCLKPKLTSVPQGDWYCNKCIKEKEKEKELASPEPAPVKKRKIFTEEDEISEQEQDVVEVVEESSDSDDCVVSEKLDVCKVCGSGGDLLCCDKCTNHYHIECVRPVLRRAPRGPWTCTACKDKDNTNKRRRDDSSDSEDEHMFIRRRTDEGRKDLPLHNAALQELLSDVMKHEDAWPFVRPVQKNEVPDYYEIISKPMDFGTLKYKLNMGEYSSDNLFMTDAVLIFENCNTYNHSNDEVYKCGVRLLKHFIKKCKELGLKLPEEMENEFNDREDGKAKSKKRRIK